MKVSVILPNGKSDYLANTVLDGLLELSTIDKDLVFKITTNYPNPFNIKEYELSNSEFTDFANDADLIILCWGKNSTNYDLANNINKWNKTIFIDGSELGKNNRFDKKIIQEVLDGTYKGIGAIDQDMLIKCKAYYRREKPYINGIIPFPFGIENRYRKFYKKDIKRDIDFTCIFGQDEYPIMRRQVKEYLEKFCKKNNLICKTKRTSDFNFDDNTKIAGRDEFYEILSRTKVGISIGGGGFDTARFWEILGSGAILMTEKIDIDNTNLKYKRIKEFSDFEDFKIKLDQMANYLKNEYNNDIEILDDEYIDVISKHSTIARIKDILNHK